MPASQTHAAGEWAIRQPRAASASFLPAAYILPSHFFSDIYGDFPQRRRLHFARGSLEIGVGDAGITLTAVRSPRSQLARRHKICAPQTSCAQYRRCTHLICCGSTFQGARMNIFLAAAFGTPMDISLSKRPGRRRAGSRTSTRFVAAMTATFC